MAKIVPISSHTWIPEDDLLLKNSIAAGASLEALAKGAVQFSRRFTFRELQDRWHSILYDPDISAHASAQMMELECSGSIPSSKCSKPDNTKSAEITAKRKIISIRRQYNAMRKKLRSELFNSTEIGFLEPSLHDCSGHPGDSQQHVTLDNGREDANCMLNDCISDHFQLQDSDFDILRRVFPQTEEDIASTTVANKTRKGFQNGCTDLVEDDQSITPMRGDSLYRFPEEIPPLIGEDVRGSFQSNIDQKDAPHMLTDDSIKNENCTNSNNVGPSQELPNGKHVEVDDPGLKRLSTFQPLNENPQNLGSGFGGRHINSPDSDGSASFHTLGFSSPLPRMPLWKTMEDISVPDMPVHMNNGDRTQGAEGTLVLPDNSEHRDRSPSRYDVGHSEPLMRDSDDGTCFSAVAVSEGEFVDLSDSLLNFSNEDELLFMDVDGKEKMDRSCYDNVNSQMINAPSDVQEGELPNIEPSKLNKSEASTSLDLGTCPGNPSSPCALESEDIASSIPDDVQQGACNLENNVASTSVSHDFTEGNICCTLNTEDPEIPCNDDIFLLIHPTTSFSPAQKPNTIDCIDPAVSADEKDNDRCVILNKIAKDPALSFAMPPVIGLHALPESFPGLPVVGCKVKSEIPDSKCLNWHPGEANKTIRDSSQSTHATPVATADGVLVENVMKVEPKELDKASTSRELALHAEANSAKLALPESVLNISVSDRDESESDNDVPYFSDIEAMILEMDLGPHDEESYPTEQVSKYQDEDAKRKIIRLEQCARSSLQRTMSSHGALAFLYGRHLKYYIRKTEVLLGRSTDDVVVDIDLRKEGRANKISRRQIRVTLDGDDINEDDDKLCSDSLFSVNKAIIKMETDGSFFLKNLGKSSISVSGKPIAGGETLSLGSSCLIEIRGMNLVFEINQKHVRRYLDTITRKSQSKKSKIEWSPGREP